MKRWPPYGTPDGTEWTNGNPATGVRGSVIDARAIDHPQQEITNTIIRFGSTPDKDDLEQLGKAIDDRIAQATGGGDTSNFVTMALARGILPIFPQVSTATGKLTITEPSSGTILVNPIGSIIHRGIFSVLVSDIAEVDRTFAMLPSKVAHIRWSPANGLERFYLDDAGYNPSSLLETDASFDSTFDSALLARVVTDASANATITTLINKDRLFDAYKETGVPTLVTGDAGYQLDVTRTLDWSRTPEVVAVDGNMTAQTVSAGSYLQGTAGYTTKDSVSRYQIDVNTFSDWNAAAVLGSLSAYVDISAMA